MLYDIENDCFPANWCGPAAFSAITGQPTSMAYTLIRVFRRSYPRRGLSNMRQDPEARITAVNDTELDFALQKVGYRAKDEPEYYKAFGGRPPKMCPTLASFLTKRSPEQRKKTLLLAVGYGQTSHFVVVEGRKFIDNSTKSPVPATEAPHRRKRVIRAMEIVRVNTS